MSPRRKLSVPGWIAPLFGGFAGGALFILSNLSW